jgi:hypothetical protein
MGALGTSGDVPNSLGGMGARERGNPRPLAESGVGAAFRSTQFDVATPQASIRVWICEMVALG